MTRTHEKVSHSPEGERIEHTPISAAQGIEQAFKFVEGRWKLLILFHLFGGKVMRFFRPGTRDFSDLSEDARTTASPLGS